MKVIDYVEAPSKTFDNDVAKGVTGRVVIGKADKADNFCMRVFTLAPGGHTPRHSHEWEHEIFVHAGEGQVFKNGEWQDVQAGSVVFVPGHEEHQFQNSSDKDFTFVCLIPAGPDEL